MTGPFGVEVINKAAKFPMPHGKGTMSPQARKQLASLKDVKGSKYIQLRHAKRVAGEKFQNKGI